MSFPYKHTSAYISQVLKPYTNNIVLMLKDALLFRPKFCPGTILSYHGKIVDNHPYNDKYQLLCKDWWLCDGSHNTPDLRNLFIMGGDAGTLGNAGGTTTHKHSVSVSTTGSIQGTKLSIGQMPKHTHSTQDNFTNITIYPNPGSSGGGHSPAFLTPNEGSPIYGWSRTDKHTSGSAGDNGAHTHGLTVSSTATMCTTNHIPPYIQLCFIMYQKS